MSVKLLRYTALYGFMSLTINVFAENPVPEFRGDTLKAVDIMGYRERGREWMPENDRLTIYAGKKTELLRLDDLGVNTVQNQSRGIFAKAPGIAVWESDGSGMQINVASRGLSPNRSWEFNVRQNGAEIAADPFGYPEAYYNPPMEAVEEIRIIRGAAGLQFGPQFGGLLDYRLRKGPADRKIQVESRQSLGSYGLWSSFNAVGGTVGRITYTAFHHHRQADGWRDNSAYRSDVSYANFAIRLSPHWKSGFALTRSTNLLQQPGGLTDAAFAEDARQSTRARNWFSTPWNLFSGSVTYEPDSSTTVALSVNGLLAERKSVGFVSSINIPDTVNTVTGTFASRQVDQDQYRNLSVELRARRDYRLFGRRHVLTAGLRNFNGTTLRQQYGKGTTATDADFGLADPSGCFPRSIDFSTGNVAVFAENVFHLTTAWSLTPGLRWESVASAGQGRYGILSDGAEQPFDASRRQRSFLLAGVGTEYAVSNEWSVYANYSRAYRPVLFSDLVPPSSLDSVDADLHDAHGYSSEFGVRGTWSDFLRMDASVFCMKYDQRIGVLQRTRDDLSTYLFRTNLGTTFHKGVEGYLEFSPLRLLNRRSAFDLSLWTAISLLDAEYGPFALATPVNGKSDLDGNRVEYAPERIHRAGMTVLAGGFRFDLNYSYTSSVFADAGNTKTPSTNAQAGIIPAWTVWDATASCRINQHFDVRLNVSNLLDARYATRRSGGYPGPGLLPGEARTVILGAGVKF